jgi:small GTP-binding protein
MDFMDKILKFRGQRIKIKIWDVAGQEKYKGLIPSYIRNSSIVFIVYDVCQHSNFEDIKSWITFIKIFEVKIVVLVGNKIDLERREVETKEGEELAKKEGLLFFECSAKTNENIMNMFYSSIARLLIIEIDNESKSDNIIRELIEENASEDFKEDRGNQDLIIISSRDGEFHKRRKKCCRCQIQ